MDFTRLPSLAARLVLGEPYRRAAAHSGVHVYVYVRRLGGRVTGSIQLPVAMVQARLRSDADRTLTESELLEKRTVVEALGSDAVQILIDGTPRQPVFGSTSMRHQQTGGYVVLPFHVAEVNDRSTRAEVKLAGDLADDHHLELIVVVPRRAGIGRFTVGRSDQYPLDHHRKSVSFDLTEAGMLGNVVAAGTEIARRLAKRVLRRDIRPSVDFTNR